MTFTEFDEAYWENRYREHAGGHVRRPNPELVATAGELTPGAALDAGCGEGADAVWLASHGWRVTATDISASALQHARKHAEGAAVGDRIEWVHGDLTAETAGAQFDLVSSHYVHPAGSFQDFVRRLAAAVRPGGTLLVVGHDSSAPHGAHAAGSLVTAQDLTDALGPEDGWEIVFSGLRERPAAGHGHALRDAVLRARKRA